MTLSQFRLLDKDKRYIVWLAKSIEIASYEKEGYSYVLYRLDDFYIEIKFVKLFPGNIIFTAFSDAARLDPFLQSIDISSIYTSQQ